VDIAGPVVVEDLPLDRAPELVRNVPGVAAEPGEAAGHAREFIDRARRSWSEAGQRLAVLRGELGRGHVPGDLGRLRDAATAGEALLDTLDELAGQTGQPRQLPALTRSNLGAAYRLVGGDERALEEYARAGTDYLAVGLQEEIVRLLANRIICLLALGRLRDAREVLAAAAFLFAGVAEPWGGKCAGGMASVRRQLGEFVAAVRVREPAGAALHELAFHAEVARIQLTTAEVYLAAGLSGDSGTAAAAAALADAAVAQPAVARLSGTAGLVEELGLPDLRHAYQLRLARLHRREGRAGEAVRLLRSAVGAAEELGSALPDPALRVAFRATQLEAHDELLDLLVARGGPGDLAEACRISDRAKAQTLIEWSTATTGLRRPAASLDAQGALLDQRSADLSAVYGAMAAAPRPEQQMLRRRASELEREISSLRLRRALAAPVAEAATAGPAGDLPAGPALAYHVAGESVIAFVLRSGQVEARRIGAVRPAVAADVDRLAAQWSRFRVGAAFTSRNEASLLATTTDSLRSLYRLLVAPVQDLLAGIEDASLAVIPHRSLHRVPFHILHDGTGYLCEQRTITLMPGTARVRPPAAVPPPARRGTLIFAVPDLLAPSIAAEARTLAAVMPEARLVLGRDASLQRLREELPGPAVLHLACHGLYRAANPLFSALRLGDRWISAAEILDLDLGGALVTLSACESGRSAADSAEPVGLAWAFLAAGASGVVVSQWLVDDDATAALMAGMYAGLAEGLVPAEALRRAQLAAAARSPHPYRWAPFVYVASPSAETWAGIGVRVLLTAPAPALLTDGPRKPAAGNDVQSCPGAAPRRRRTWTTIRTTPPTAATPMPPMAPLGSDVSGTVRVQQTVSLLPSPSRAVAWMCALPLMPAGRAKENGTSYRVDRDPLSRGLA
jgi:hypothetical protein